MLAITPVPGTVTLWSAAMQRPVEPWTPPPAWGEWIPILDAARAVGLSRKAIGVAPIRSARLGARTVVVNVADLVAWVNGSFRTVDPPSFKWNAPPAAPPQATEPATEPAAPRPDEHTFAPSEGPPPPIYSAPMLSETASSPHRLGLARPC